MKWVIDNSHSVAEFSVRHMMVSTAKGRFQKVDGTIEWDEVNPANTTIEANIETASIYTGDEKRDGHLRSGDFFDAEKYPSLTFKSTKVEKLSDEEYRVTGDLTIRDATHPVVLNVEYNGQGKNPWGMTVAGFSARTSISRKEWGLNWNVALETGGVLVSDKVQINLDIEAALQTAPVEAAAQA